MYFAKGMMLSREVHNTEPGEGEFLTEPEEAT